MGEVVLQKLDNQIDIDKEVLSVLPKTNKKNLKIYKDKAIEIKANYETYFKDILAEIKRRKVKILSLTPNPEIEKLKKQIEEKSYIKKANKDIPSFEKMELDEILFVLKRFYKNNLELVNDAIVRCLEKFEMVGIILSENDFNYSIHVKEYMKVFLAERRRGEINSPRVKDVFEQIYWKCPDIIMHIELSFRNLYLKNEKIIDKYFEEVQKNNTSKINIDEKEAIENYEYMQRKLTELENADTALILQKFLRGEENIKDYEDANVNKLYKKFVNGDYESMDKKQKEEYTDNIFKLQSSLYEYMNYLDFKFIFDDILEIYKSKDKFKSLYNANLKKIKSLEAQVEKMNKKTEKLERHKSLLIRLFCKKNNNLKLEKINVDVNAKLNEIRDLYRDLEKNKVSNIICTNLNDNSTIYDALLLINPFYSFLVDSIIKKDNEILQEDIKEMVRDFREFIDYPNITILNNIKILEEKDIALMIKDKYNLCNINMTKGDLSDENISNLEASVNKICNYNYLKNSKTNLDDVKFVLQADKILSNS